MGGWGGWVSGGAAKMAAFPIRRSRGDRPTTRLGGTPRPTGGANPPGEPRLGGTPVIHVGGGRDDGAA